MGSKLPFSPIDRSLDREHPAMQEKAYMNANASIDKATLRYYAFSAAVDQYLKNGVFYLKDIYIDAETQELMVTGTEDYLLGIDECDISFSTKVELNTSWEITDPGDEGLKWIKGCSHRSTHWEFFAKYWVSIELIYSANYAVLFEQLNTGVRTIVIEHPVDNKQQLSLIPINSCIKIGSETLYITTSYGETSYVNPLDGVTRYKYQYDVERAYYGTEEPSSYHPEGGSISLLRYLLTDINMYFDNQEYKDKKPDSLRSYGYRGFPVNIESIEEETVFAITGLPTYNDIQRIAGELENEDFMISGYLDRVPMAKSSDEYGTTDFYTTYGKKYEDVIHDYYLRFNYTYQIVSTSTGANTDPVPVDFSRYLLPYGGESFLATHNIKFLDDNKIPGIYESGLTANRVLVHHIDFFARLFQNYAIAPYTTVPIHTYMDYFLKRESVVDNEVQSIYYFDIGDLSFSVYRRFTDHAYIATAFAAEAAVLTLFTLVEWRSTYYTNADDEVSAIEENMLSVVPSGVSSPSFYPTPNRAKYAYPVPVNAPSIDVHEIMGGAYSVEPNANIPDDIKYRVVYYRVNESGVREEGAPSDYVTAYAGDDPIRMVEIRIPYQDLQTLEYFINAEDYDGIAIYKRTTQSPGSTLVRIIEFAELETEGYHAWIESNDYVSEIVYRDENLTASFERGKLMSSMNYFPPNTAKYMIVHNDRLFYSGISAKKYDQVEDSYGDITFVDSGETEDVKNRLFYSEYAYIHAFPKSNTFWFKGEITGLASIDEMLYIGTKEGLYMAYGYDIVEVRCLRPNQHIAERSMQSVSGVCFYTTYLDGYLNNVYYISSNEYKQIGDELGDLLKDYEEDEILNSQSLEDRYYILEFADKFLIYDLKFGGWFVRDFSSDTVVLGTQSIAKSDLIIYETNYMNFGMSSDAKQVYQVEVEYIGDIKIEIYNNENQLIKTIERSSATRTRDRIYCGWMKGYYFVFRIYGKNTAEVFDFTIYDVLQ